MGFLDRLLTIVVTATLTSAAWIVFGSGFMRAEPSATQGATEDAPTGPSQPAPSVGATPAMVSPVGPLPAQSSANGYLIPVVGVTAAQLTDTFSDMRGGGTRPHEALDIMAPRGTPVVAAAEGKVEKLFLSDAGGKTVYVRSPDRQTIYYYAHLDGYAPGLREGQDLRKGAPIGQVGSTGNASPDGPHLHFAIMRTTPGASWYDKSTAINPYPLLTGSSG